MSYKLIAMDLDGTLNNDKKSIDPPTLRALFAAQRRGVRLLLASARPLPGLFKERDALDLAAHHGLLMAYNGGAIVDAATGEALSSTTMSLDDARRVLIDLEALPVTPIIDNGARFYVTDASGYKVDYECRNNRMECTEVPNLAAFLSFPPCKILMSVKPDALKAVQRRIAALLPSDLAVVQTAPFYLEVIPARINKGVGLINACAAAGLSPAEAIAFGDSENDIEMLRAAGMGVAMANADDAVKSAADMVTLSNNENGIAAALAKLLPWTVDGDRAEPLP